MKRKMILIFAILSIAGGTVFAEMTKYEKALDEVRQGKMRPESVQEIERVGKPAAIELRKLMKDKKADQKARVSAIVLMGKIKSQEDQQDLEDILQNDDDKHGREAAAIALGHMGTTKAIPKLKKALKDPSGNVRMRAAQSLGKMGDKSGKDAALEAMRGSDVTAIILAVDALEAIGDKGAIPELKKNLEDKNSAWTKIYSKVAIKRLEMIGITTDKRLQFLKETLKDEQYEVNRWAAEELGRIGTPEAVQILKDAASDTSIAGNYSAGKVLMHIAFTKGQIKTEDMNK